MLSVALETNLSLSSQVSLNFLFSQPFSLSADNKTVNLINVAEGKTDDDETRTALQLMREKFVRLGSVHRSSLDSKLVAVVNNMLPKLEKDKILLQGLVNSISPNEVLIWTNMSLGNYLFCLQVS